MTSSIYIFQNRNCAGYIHLFIFPFPARNPEPARTVQEFSMAGFNAQVHYVDSVYGLQTMGTFTQGA